mmetsp:Transcript_7912/g.11737  ORF Transcript_7912/g.11737 Transcript_7912/m.11737 type:complete len:887 (+) Transcript_7912:186-2846(+)
MSKSETSEDNKDNYSYQKKDPPLGAFRSIWCTIVFLVILMSTSIILVTVLWIVNFAISVSQLSTGIRTATFNGLSTYVQTQMKIPQAISAGLIGFVEGDLLDDGGSVGDKYDEVYDFLWKSYSLGLSELEDFYNLDYVSTENNRLQYVYFSGSPEEVFFHRVSWEDITNSKYSKYQVNINTGKLTFVENVVESQNEAALYTNYRNSVLQEAQNTYIWKKPYLDCVTTDSVCTLFIELQYNVFNQTLWRGTIKSSVGGKGLSQFLSKNIRTDAVAFILDVNDYGSGASNTYIASSVASTSNDLADLEKGKHSPELFTVSNYPNELIKSIGAEVVKRPALTSGSLDSFVVGTHDVDVFDFTNAGGLKWKVVHALPTTAFIQAPLIIGIITGIISLIITILALTCGILTSVMIARPLMRLILEMSYVQKMKLDRINTTRLSYFNEIRQIQKAFYYMTDKLKEYKAFLPSNLLPSNVETEKTPLLAKSKDKTMVKSMGNDASFASLGQADEADSEVGSILSYQSSNINAINQAKKKGGFLNRFNGSFAGSIASTVATARFNRQIEQKAVSTLHLQIAGFDRIVTRGFSPRDFVEQHGTLLDDIISIAGRQKGSICDFDSSGFVLGFNTTIPSKDHPTKACQTAILIRRKLELLNKSWLESAKDEIHLHMGITTGECFVGNIGSSQSKKPAVFGEPYEVASSFSTLCADLGVDVVIDEETDKRIPHTNKEMYQTRPLDLIRIPKISTTTTYMAIQLLDHLKFEGDEWMYEMQNLARMKKYEPCVEAFQAFQRGDIEESLKIIAKYQESHPEEDEQLVRMKRLFSQCKDKQVTFKIILNEAKTRPTNFGISYESIFDFGAAAKSGESFIANSGVNVPWDKDDVDSDEFIDPF